MTYVLCVILGAQVPGVVVDKNEDMWLVRLKHTTVWVDSNRCLVKVKK